MQIAAVVHLWDILCEEYNAALRGDMVYILYAELLRVINAELCAKA